jgi:16S rRNA (cytosine1402-N4)-methyltransferase
MIEQRHPESLHEPVLFEAVCEFLAGPDKEWLADLTLGMAGHASGLLAGSPKARLLGIDRDPVALELARRRLAAFEPRTRLFCESFERFAGCRQSEADILGFDSILADLGVSSLQLDDADRGFSFRHNAPLDMRMGPNAGRTAADWLNQEDEETLARIFRDYGDEPAAKKIAAALVKGRGMGPITTTTEFADLVRRFARTPRSKNKKRRAIDPATRSFQALRIAVNDELGSLERTLPQLLEALNPEGRVAIISFHSLEDRIVKKQFKSWASSGEGQILTSKPRTANDCEIASNPRARSARLRVFQRRS